MNYLEAYYNSYNEEGRLLSRHGQVEYRTTMKYIEESLAGISDPSILEIGAGTGRYSVTLAKQGRRVTALELIAHNLEILRSKLDGTESICAMQGNALDLSMFSDSAFDLTMLLGPMYHLYKKEEKLRALSEAVRVTKPGGHILVAYCMNEPTVIQYVFGLNHLREVMDLNMLTPDWRCISERKKSRSWMPRSPLRGSNWSPRTVRQITSGNSSTRWMTRPSANGWSIISRSVNGRI